MGAADGLLGVKALTWLLGTGGGATGAGVVNALAV